MLFSVKNPADKAGFSYSKIVQVAGRAVLLFLP